MLDSRFSYETLRLSPARETLLRELEVLLRERLTAAHDAEAEGHRIAEDLCTLGYSLCSFDASTDFQIWCADWISGTRTEELILTLDYPEDGAPSVSAIFQDIKRGA